MRYQQSKLIIAVCFSQQICPMVGSSQAIRHKQLDPILNYFDFTPTTKTFLATTGDSLQAISICPEKWYKITIYNNFGKEKNE